MKTRKGGMFSDKMPDFRKILEEIKVHPEEIKYVTDEVLLRKCIIKNSESIIYLTPELLLRILIRYPDLVGYFKAEYELKGKILAKAIQKNEAVLQFLDYRMFERLDISMEMVQEKNDLLLTLFQRIPPIVRRELIERVKIDYSLFILELRKPCLFFLAYIPEEKLEENIDAILRLSNIEMSSFLYLPLPFLIKHIDKFAKVPSYDLTTHLLKMLKLPYSLRPFWIEQGVKLYGTHPMVESARHIETRLIPYKNCLKSVTVLIDAHGIDLEDKLPPHLPWNTAISGSIGLSAIGDKGENVLEVLRKHENLKLLYEENNIKNANLLLSELEFGYFLQAVYEKDPAMFKDEIEKCPQLKERYKMNRHEHNYLRSYTNNRLYSIEREDNRQYSMGIYVIHTTNPELMPTFKGKLTHIDKVNNYLPDYKSLLQYNALQERNLFNVKVEMDIESQKTPNAERCFVKGATVLTPGGIGYIRDITSKEEEETSGIEGVELTDFFPRLEYTVRIQDVDYTYSREELARPTIPEVPKDPKNPEGYSLEDTRDVSERNGLEKYNFIRLSSILAYFQRLGFDHVNLIDNTCRPSRLPQDLQRSKSKDETERYGVYGGRTRRKKKTLKMIRRSKKLKRK